MQQVDTQQLADKIRTEERRYITIMFTDLSASTAIAADMEPEAYNAILEKMRTTFASIISKHGGDTVRIDGDGFIFMFGFPTSFEDTARRAVEAALDIHNAVDAIDEENTSSVPLRLHTGIHSGIVLLKTGDLVRGKYEIIGDPTNVAARICEFAAPGEIVVSEESLGRLSNLFQITQQYALNVAGRSEKILLNKVVGRKYIEDGQTSAKITAFTGRKRVMDWLSAFGTKPQPEPKTALIVAEAGMGKTRLLLEFSNRMTKQGVSIHTGLCQSYVGASPYQPLDQICNSIFRSEFGTSSLQHLENKSNVSRECSKMLEVISASTKDSDKSEFRANQYLDAFCALLASRQDSKCILILDDWQWVDDASRKVIGVLANSDIQNLKIILASRELDRVFVEMNNVANLTLSPLDPKESELTISSLLPGVEPFTLKEIQQYSGGNPLYIEELCHAFKDARFTAKGARTTSLITPLISSRFSQLPGDLADIVKICAVIGHVVPERLLESISGKSLTIKKLEELRKQDFLHPAETAAHIRFKHGLTRDVIYEMIGLQERQKLHKYVIEKLRNNSSGSHESQPHEQLAYHYAQSGQAESSIHHSKMAGEIALEVSSLDKAQTHFKNAISLADRCGLGDSDKLELFQKFGRACVVDPSRDQSEILVNAVLFAENLSDKRAIAWSEYWLGCNYYGLGLPYLSLKHFKRSFEVSKTLDLGKLRTQLLANLGQAYASACEYETAYELLDEAIEVKQTNRSGTRPSPGLAYALSSKGYALGEQGRFEASIICFDQAKQALGDAEHEAETSVLNQRAAANLWNGDFEECLRLTAKNMDMSRRMHSRYNYAMAAFMRSTVNYYQTGDTSHIDKMIESTNWLVYDGIGQNLSLNYGCIAEALAQNRNWKETRIYAARCIRRARLGDKSCESQAYRALALLAQENQCWYPTEHYMARAYNSAELRNSVREINNNRYFENRYLDRSHQVEKEHLHALYYLD